MKRLAVVLSCIFFSSHSFAGDLNFYKIPLCEKVGYYSCDPQTECKFVAHANMGLCVNLINFKKGFAYSCTIDGLAYISSFDMEYASESGFDKIKIERKDPQTILINFDTFNMINENGEMHFTLELMGDIPSKEDIKCNIAWP